MSLFQRTVCFLRSGEVMVLTIVLSLVSGTALVGYIFFG